ncbi:MAG: class I SAM-dependent methyltransferase [Candidatus Nanoarchaeia archaeon]|nr:class I SAM-dependent methyltransferase [Candidatus Nanoarchaeia archaeon]
MIKETVRIKMEKEDILTASFYDDPEVVKSYNDIRYSSKGGKICDKRQMESFFNVVNNVKGKKILEIGCGVGRFTKLLSERGADVTGVDTSKNMIDYCKKNDKKGTYLVANALELPFKDKSFDIVYSISVFNHLKSYETAISELARVSRDKVILGFPNKVSLLSIAYLYRWVRHGNLKYSTSDTKKGKRHQPYGIYFSIGQMKKLLRKNNLQNLGYDSSLMFNPLWMPNLFPNFFYRMDKIMSKILRPFMTHIILYGYKK